MISLSSIIIWIRSVYLSPKVRVHICFHNRSAISDLQSVHIQKVFSFVFPLDVPPRTQAFSLVHGTCCCTQRHHSVVNTNTLSITVVYLAKTMLELTTVSNKCHSRYQRQHQGTGSVSVRICMFLGNKDPRQSINPKITADLCSLRTSPQSAHL